MGIAISEDHAELARIARAFLQRHDALAAARAALEGDSGLPAFWKDMADLGWLGLHIPEHDGGSGYGVLELAVVVEELGRVCAPGPFLPTVVASGVVAAVGADEQRAQLLPGLVSGEKVAGLGVHGSLRLADGTLDGDAGPVLSATAADVLALVVGDDLVLVDRFAAGVTTDDRAALDATRPSAAVRCEAVPVAEGDILRGGAAVARRLLGVLTVAEAAGGAAACCELAAAYAKDRIAFGRPIGQFQAVKHQCADMLIDAETATAVAWDAARRDPAGDTALADSVAEAVALPAYLRCAKRNIQVHGGIGFTWEHDAHLYLRRAGALSALLGPVDRTRAAVARLAAAQDDTHSALELPPEAEPIRQRVRAFVEAYKAQPEDDRHRFLVEEGYLFPHWPQPWGLGAGPLEQLVIEQELEGIPRESAVGPTAWTLPIVLPTIMNHGTDDQRERWIRPTMEGALAWCQLFSEPGAGSDLAALSTRAERADGGWLVTGQKVWTSHAQYADRGFALVRTDPEAPKHKGITCMVVDMKARGVTIRPLRQITGTTEFNEVFLDEVFVPDEDVVGDVNRGWSVARTTLDNERVSLGDNTREGGFWQLVQHIGLQAGDDDPKALVDLGALTATGMAVRAMNLRSAARAISGGAPGVEGNLTKLISAETIQRVADFAFDLLGPAGLYADGDSAMLTTLFLGSRMATIAGGTSEVVRNVIGERLLGLPRDASA